MKKILFLLVCAVGATKCFSQYSSRSLSKQQQAYTDSLKNVKYDYTFPIWGQKAYKLGFDIPYPVGIMTNYFYAKQGLMIENLRLGLKTQDHDIPLTGVDFVQFSKNTSTASTFNVRPDIWILPFLDVYGIFGYGNSITEVNVVSPVEIKSVVKQSVKTAGFGLTGAFGLGPMFVAVDMNWTWNKPEKLNKPVDASVLSIRLGHTFTFKTKPERNIGIWVGAMRARIGSETVGEITLADALPAEMWSKKNQIVSDYYSWYNSLDPNKISDQKKIAAADKVLTPIFQKLDATDGSAVVRYGIDKRPEQEWNMVVGGQFQLNKSWAFRTEAGIVGDRKSFLLSANYRFKI